MATRARRIPRAAAFAALLSAGPALASAGANDWLSFRGPSQDGSSTETGLPDEALPGKKGFLWSFDLPGRGTPVIAAGKLYTLGYTGQGADVREVLLALDAATGKELWRHEESDFLSDVVYDRYSLGSPTVDGETGNVYALTAAGLFSAFTGDGKMIFQRSLMEELGRMTFPNGRNGSPVVDGDLVIVRAFTANWGGQSAPRDRFYAFDKRTGEEVWASTPGEQPVDNSFSMPVLSVEDGRRVFYAGDGDGSVVAVDARSGAPLWRFVLSAGGVNASVLARGGRVIAVHGVENLDASTTGRMVAIDPSRRSDGKAPSGPGEPGPFLLGKSAEVWRADVSSFSSSPVLAGNRIYQVDDTGALHCLDADTGKERWKEKLARDQIHASPLFADGKLYVPMNDGSFYVLRPGDDGVKILSRAQLDGACLGAPSVAAGRVYVHTTAKLYCFGNSKSPVAKNTIAVADTVAGLAPAGPATQLQARPAELLLSPGQRATLRARRLDAHGRTVGDAVAPTWKPFIPPTAKVRSTVDATIDAEGVLVAAASAKPSAGAFEVSDGGLHGTLRGRIVPSLPYSEDFESYPIAEPHPTEPGVKFGYPPLPWVGGRAGWELRELAGNKVLAKSLDRPMSQRSLTFIGAADAHDYTVAADVYSDGNKRGMSDVGVVNQRYLIALKGSWQQLEVSSNYERVRVAVPVKWKTGTWYRLLTRVDVAPDGSGVVRAKVWPRGEPEPAAWTLEAPQKKAHTHGSPGVYGFAPQNRFRVYLDNLSVTQNAPAATRKP